jgi:hypothetical protein
MFLRKFGVCLQVQSVFLPTRPASTNTLLSVQRPNAVPYVIKGELRDLGRPLGEAVMKGSADLCWCLMTRRLFYDRGFVT